MEHYVVILDWATNDSESVEILGVFHTFEEAEVLYKSHLDYERQLAKENGYTVEEDVDGFEAYAEGYYSAEHTHLYIQGV